VRRDRDLAHAKPVLGRAAILQDAHLDRPAEDHLAASRADY